ncbi:MULTISPECIES: enoyl-CoA hydratase/isomerase family protein [unclassified Achromobacter]|uniref:enoyl-CoA hydratase/isomerase family protein n=1 Tax=unclassified Achromobacter TaxID=2626865 RepID=UPI000B5191D5|nr:MULTISPECIES: enoyl-CoA hydratase-related protein [unclassified Achromobacter]OWT71433.1 enoyl-CoA hydratase [Achromobacter sp. HZ34]OWT73090.1 enoyl-CoA hydratase [Achromobacter sp. HZ28]
MSEPIIVERDGAIATVILNSPDKMNAMNEAMWQGLADAMAGLSADDDVRCIVLRGAGERAFSAGADIEEFPRTRRDKDAARAYGRVTHRAMQAVAGSRHPTLAVIHGACVGGGLELAAVCDMRICGASSRFGAPINRLGLVMSYGELGGLVALAGRAVALEIVLEGRVFGAEEAQRKGLVNRVVDDAMVNEEGLAAARRIAAGAPLVARWHKRFVQRLDDPRPLTEAELDEAYDCFDTEDFGIGYRAFLAKTRPAFVGR